VVLVGERSTVKNPYLVKDVLMEVQNEWNGTAKQF